MIAFNATNFVPRKYQTSEDWKSFFVALYYLLEASSTDIAAIRAGTSIICDCDLIGWDNFSNTTQIDQYGSKLYRDSYPIRIQEITMVQTPWYYRAIYQLYKPFMSPHTKEVLNMSGTIVELKDKYSQKNLPKRFDGFLGNWDVKKKLTTALTKRYETKATFAL